MVQARHVESRRNRPALRRAGQYVERIGQPSYQRTSFGNDRDRDRLVRDDPGLRPRLHLTRGFAHGGCESNARVSGILLPADEADRAIAVRNAAEPLPSVWSVSVSAFRASDQRSEVPQSQRRW